MDLSNARGLTVRQPFAYAIADLNKRVENRMTGVKCTDTLLIHAGNEWMRGAGPVFTAAGFVLPIDGQLPRGVVVAVARIAGVCDRSRYTPTVECQCGPWAMPGQMHWQFADVVTLDEPVPCRGSLGVWPVPPDVLAAVEAQVP